MHVEHIRHTAADKLEKFTNENAAAQAPGNAQFAAEKNVPLTLEILQSFQQPLRAYARKISRCPHDADDLVQDTIIRAWENRHQFQSGTNPRAWLFTILRNRWFSVRRHRSCFDRIAPLYVQHVLQTECEAASSLDAEEIVAAVERLSPKHRQVVLLFSTGRPYEDLAREIGVPCGTFKSRLFRAREALQAEA